MQAASTNTPIEINNPRGSAREWAKTAVLVGLALYFIYNIFSGNLTNYINVRFAWLAYVAVLIFIALAVANIYELFRPQAASPLDVVRLARRKAGRNVDRAT